MFYCVFLLFPLSCSDTTRRVQFSQHSAERTTRLLRTNTVYETSKVQLPGLASAPSTALGSETNGFNSVGEGPLNATRGREDAQKSSSVARHWNIPR
eukprot:3882676-Pyramimonas_sp.AAC.1